MTYSKAVSECPSVRSAVVTGAVVTKVAAEAAKVAEATKENKAVRQPEVHVA